MVFVSFIGSPLIMFHAFFRCFWCVFFWNSWPAKLSKFVHINLTGKPGIHHWLVVSTHLKHISQIGSFPQVGMKMKNIWNHHPDHESTNESTNESIRKLVSTCFTILRPKRNEISEGFSVFPPPKTNGWSPETGDQFKRKSSSSKHACFRW